MTACVCCRTVKPDAVPLPGDADSRCGACRACLRAVAAGASPRRAGEWVLAAEHRRAARPVVVCTNLRTRRVLRVHVA